MWLELVLWRARRWSRTLGALDRAALVWLVLVLSAALLAPALTDRALAIDSGAIAAPPGAAHLLGTDHLGRDICWRLLVGARAFVGPALLALLLAWGLGVPIGLLSGWSGGPAYHLLGQLTAVVAAVPRFVLALLVLSVFGNEPLVLGMAAGWCWAPALADAIRTRVAGLRHDAFLLAARAHGVPRIRLLNWHVLLGACGDLLVIHALQLLGFVIVLETSLSYLGGFGVQQPLPSWGNMLAFDWGWPVHPLAAAAPAVVLWLTLVALAVLARSKREAP